MATSHDDRTTLPTFMAAGALLAVFGQWLLSSTPVGNRAGVLWPLAAGLLVFGASVALQSSERLGARGSKFIRDTAGRMGLQEWQLAAVFLAPIFAVMASLAAGGGQKMIDLPLAVTTWLLAIALIIVGTWRTEAVTSKRPSSSKNAKKPARAARQVQRWDSDRAQYPLKRWEIPALVVLGIAAFLLRGLNTAHIPALLTGDEGSAGLQAVRTVGGEVNNIFSVGWYGFPQLYFALQSIFVRLLGATTAAIRLPSALIGSLTVVATYFLGKALFGARAGWVAAIFLAGFHFHVHFSRIALNNVWDAFWYAVVLLALWVGWRDNRRAAYLGAGVALGLSQYFYSSARALIVLVLLWLLIAGIADRKRLRDAVPHIIVMLLAAAVVALPSILDFARQPNEYLAPFRRFSILGPWLANEIQLRGQPAHVILLKQLGLALGAFTFVPLRHWYQPDTALLRALPAGLFLLGILVMAIRWRESRVQLLWLWLFAFVMVACLSDSTPASQRLVGVAPACALVVAVAVEQLIKPIEGRWKVGSAMLSAVAIATAVFMALSDANFYFRVYTPKSVQQQAHSNGAIAQAVAEALQDDEAGSQVAFLGSGMGYYSIPSIQYLAPQVKGVDFNQPWGDSQNPTVDTDQVVFIILPGREADLAALQSSHPGGALSTVPAVDGRPLFWMYELR